jgi:hypothetical protein
VLEAGHGDCHFLRHRIWKARFPVVEEDMKEEDNGGTVEDGVES